MTGPRLLECGELNVANDLLGRPQALAQAWARDGYWFFRGVLDPEAVSRVRVAYLDFLAANGWVAPGDDRAAWTGADLESFPLRIDALSGRELWKALLDAPAARTFFTRLLGDDPLWIPIAEYRITPPRPDAPRQRFEFLHQDGYFNEGIPFRICWIPLVEIGPDTGGLAIAEGLHRGPCLHTLASPPVFTIPDEAVPPHAWRRADYRPGDLLMFDLNTPHSGLTNLSGRFRLSLDIRVMPRSGERPAIGEIVDLAPDVIAIRSDDGLVRLAIDDSTYCRTPGGDRISREQLARVLHPGDRVIAGVHGGVATVIREPRA